MRYAYAMRKNLIFFGIFNQTACSVYPQAVDPTYDVDSDSMFRKHSK
jgi:hypothetical protein